MSRHVHAIATLAAIATAGLILATPPATAGSGQMQILPRVKGYNFKASPSKIRRLCINFWKGRFWYQKPYYGCDGVKFNNRRYRVGCNDNQLDCVISHVARSMGPDGANGEHAQRNGNGKP